MTLKQYLQNKYSQSTLKSNLYNIKRFTDYYDKRAEEATYKDVLNYIEHLRKNHKLHPKTLGHQLYAVKIYFNYLLEVGKRKDHPCSELYLKDKINKQIQVDNLYSLEALEYFLDSYQIKQKKHLQTRNKVIISLLIYQALTVREIADLEVKDINLDQAEIQIRNTNKTLSKSPRNRILALQAKQILLFYNYLKKDRNQLLKYNKANPKEQSFILGQYGEKIHPHSISKMINENRAHSDKIPPIKIRQSVIANLLKKENDLRVVQAFSGHRRISTTLQYKQSDLEQLQNAIKLYHPVQ